ncbi:MAG: peptidoglycan DD-metalloendopeptidase family protein [Anaerolineae bacterium]|nr:peptidoglycan DD-metalloendopeptidase family protein [Anaerolineae bacterium]
MRKGVAFLVFALSLLAGLPFVAAAGSRDAGHDSAGEAIRAVVELYETQIAPSQPLATGDVYEEGDWAYAIAQPADHDSPAIIPILAQRTADGWLALAPATAPASEFNAWLAALPASLMDGSLKGYLQVYDPALAPATTFRDHLLPWPGGRTGVVTYKDGSGHYGQIDFAIERDVYSSKAGRVVFIKESSPDPEQICSSFQACWRKANMVVIQHGPAEYSWYVHLAYDSVPDNIWVNKEIPAGVKIGVEGRTGYTYGETGYHLHFMVSTGHYPWTDPNDPDALPWATGIEQTDFVERSWGELFPNERYLSVNYAADMPQRSSLDGVVRDSYGRPAAGATLALLPSDGPGAALLAASDGLGTYKFQQVVEGAYVAGAGQDGFWQMAAVTVAGSGGVDGPPLLLTRPCGSAGELSPEREIESLVCDGAAPAQPLAGPAAASAGSAAAPLVLSAQPGIDNVYLHWEATNSIEVSQYRVLRAVGDSSTLTTVSSTAQTFYVDTNPIAAETRVCYQVQARRQNGAIVASSNLACTVGQTVSLWVPHAEARPHDRIRIPVNIRNARGLRLDSATIALDYDPRVLGLLAVTPGSLASDYDWYTSVTVNSTSAQVRVQTLPSEAPSLYGSGALFWLTFDVLPSNVISSTLNLREYLNGSGSAIYTPGSPAEPAPLALLDGNFYVEPLHAYGSGDLNGDGAVTAADATSALRVASNWQQATARQIRAAEVTGDGRVGAADGSAVLAYADTASWPAMPSAPPAPAPGPAVVSIDAAAGILGGLAKTRLRVSDGGNWAGGVFWLAYDPALVAGVVAATPVGSAAGAQAAVYDAGAGLARIVVSSAAPLAADGAFVELTLRVGSMAPSGSRTPLVLVDAALHDAAGRDYATSALQIPVSALSSILSIDYEAAFLPSVQR